MFCNYPFPSLPPINYSGYINCPVTYSRTPPDSVTFNYLSRVPLMLTGWPAVDKGIKIHFALSLLALQSPEQQRRCGSKWRCWRRSWWSMGLADASRPDVQHGVDVLEIGSDPAQRWLSTIFLTQIDQNTRIIIHWADMRYLFSINWLIDCNIWWGWGRIRVTYIIVAYII